MVEFDKTIYVNAIRAVYDLIGESGDIKIGDIDKLDCAVQSYVDAFMTDLTNSGYGDEAKDIVFISAFQDCRMWRISWF